VAKGRRHEVKTDYTLTYEQLAAILDEAKKQTCPLSDIHGTCARLPSSA
jgi:hypothetical protein